VNVPPNIPYIIKLLIALATLIIHILAYVIWKQTYITGTALNVGMIIMMVWVSFFVDLASRRSYVMNRKTQKQLENIEKEQDRNENLVLSALPMEIATRLKSSPESTYDSIKDGSVCFAKLCGFDDQLREEGADQLAILNVLNELFTKFDEITSAYKCTKIKSIGCTFMAVSGCPTYTPDHAVRIAHLSRMFMLASRKVFERRKHIVPLVAIRIGIMCGDFVAGVLGETKYLFDVFGNSVNVAARMSTTSEYGTIQCCEPMYDHLKNHFALIDRGTVFVKGKGDLHVWTLDIDDETIAPLGDVPTIDLDDFK
jgi:adenylate cyclase